MQAIFYVSGMVGRNLPARAKKKKKCSRWEFQGVWVYIQEKIIFGMNVTKVGVNSIEEKMTETCLSL